MIKISKIALITGLVIGMASCQKPPEYPDEPVIEFKNFETLDDSAIFTFSFTDGDGDVGLKEKDTTGKFAPDQKYYYNLFLEYYEKKNGQFEKIDLLVPFYYRVPFIETEGKNKALNGEISITISPYFYDFTSPNDTFKYSAYFVDRALHESNTIETPAMVKPQN